MIQKSATGYRFLLLLAVATAAACAGGCGSGSSSKAPPPAAFKADVGLLVDGRGPRITAPKVVTVTWTVDPLAGALEDFGDKIGASSYWKSTMSEYGIGPTTSGPPNHVRIAAPPWPTLDLPTLEDWIVQQVSNPATSGWPAPDPSTLYVIYIPSTTQVTPKGPAHSEVTVANVPVPYVRIDENGHGDKSIIDYATANASHEIAEVATNPHSQTDPGLVGFDDTHIAWQMSSEDAELGDLCERDPDAVFKGPADLPYALQRLWSNKAAAAGQNPCVPHTSDPYYNIAPLELETLSVLVNTARNPQTGLGYRVPIGTEKTIKLGFYSSPPTNGPWTITAVEGSWFSPGSNKRLTIAISGSTGQNGDTCLLTVTANPSAPGAGNAVLITVTSQAPGLAPHSVPILIGTY